MKLALALSAGAALAVSAQPEPDTFVPTALDAPLLEQFTDAWEARWSPSHATKKSPVGSGETFSYVGVWSVEEPTVFPGLKGDKGLVMKSKAAHHAISAPVSGGIKVASGKPLVVQYETKLQKGLDCGGAYVKLLAEDPAESGEEFSDKTPFTIMFGPDKCGATNKVHFIFRHRNPLTGEYEEKHLDGGPAPKITKTSALYTLIVNPDDTFEIKINDESVKTGSLADSFTPAVNPPATIADPASTKPADWIDSPTMPDPDAVKPDDWDESAPAMIVDSDATKPEGWLEEESETIPDPEAEVPEEWDDEEDGDWLAPSVPNPACEDASGCGPWTAPLIPNPAYKGPWSAPLVPNPAYVGPWAPEQIPNPAFFEDSEIAKGLDEIKGVGLELWTMTNDMLFDNIYVGHSPEDAAALAAESFHKKLALEQAAEQAFLEDEDEDDKARAGGSSGHGLVGRVLEAGKDKYDEFVSTWPEFFELATNDWRAALEKYPAYIATLAALFLSFAGVLSTLLALLTGSSAPVASKAAPKAKRTVEGAKLAPVVLEGEVVEGAKTTAVEVGGDGGDVKLRKATQTAE